MFLWNFLPFFNLRPLKIPMVRNNAQLKEEIKSLIVSSDVMLRQNTKFAVFLLWLFQSNFILIENYLIALWSTSSSSNSKWPKIILDSFFFQDNNFISLTPLYGEMHAFVAAFVFTIIRITSASISQYCDCINCLKLLSALNLSDNIYSFIVVYWCCCNESLFS